MFGIMSSLSTNRWQVHWKIDWPGKNQIYSEKHTILCWYTLSTMCYSFILQKLIRKDLNQATSMKFGCIILQADEKTVILEVGVCKKRSHTNIQLRALRTLKILSKFPLICPHQHWHSATNQERKTSQSAEESVHACCTTHHTSHRW